jgi:hypothetical protein
LAQYRNGRYEDARATLARCDRLRRQQGRKGVPQDVAVLAMSLFRLDQVEEARLTFERLEGIIKDPDVGWIYTSEDARALFEECRKLLGEPGVPMDPGTTGHG